MTSVLTIMDNQMKRLVQKLRGRFIVMVEREARRRGIEMAIVTDSVVTRRVMDGKAEAVTRYFGGGECPYRPKEKLTLRDQETRTDYAAVEILTVAPERFDVRSANDTLAQNEGFSGAQAWQLHMQRLYGQLEDDAVVYRVRFKLLEVIDPEASERTEQEQ